MKIGIIGSRGIPNRYGGFEQLAERLSVGLYAKGHSVTVYNSHKHPYQQKDFNGVSIVHCYDAEHLLGTAGQFIYDRNCLRDARKRKFDVLLFLGYTSSSVWWRGYPRNTTIIYNMDGMEWQRKKYAAPVRKFLQYAEQLAVRHGHFFIADSPVIQAYLLKKYAIPSTYIAYGADIVAPDTVALLQNHSLSADNYFLLMARMEPENNIEMLLEGFHNSDTVKKMVVIGNTANRYGKYIVGKYSKDDRIRFEGALFDPTQVRALKQHASIYFHGHSVGGTNPSLLEAMADGVLLAAHDNPFNRFVLENNARYFNSPSSVKAIIEKVGDDRVSEEEMIHNNLEKIRASYSWDSIIDKYEKFIIDCSREQLS